MRFSTPALLSATLALLAGAFLLAGCDSGGSDDGRSLGENATFSFATDDGGTVTEDGDDTYEMTVVVDDPGFQGLSVQVVFDEEASGVNFDEISGIDRTTTLTFPESTTDSTTRTLTFEVEDDDEIGEMGEDVVFTLQSPENGSIGANGSYTLTVNDDDLEAIDIAAALAMSNGEVVAVEGIVTRVEGSNVRIQDETGGIVVRDGDLADAVGGVVPIGAQIRVMGELDAFNGLRQLSGDDVRYMVTDDDAGLPDAQTVDVSDVTSNGEEYESELVRIEDLGFAPGVAGGTFEGSTNYTVGNAMGDSLTLRVPGDSFYVGEDIPGGTFTFVGIVGQFSSTGEGGYQLLPTQEGDLTDIEQVGPTIISIADARAMDLGTTVTVEGVFTRIEGSNARIQDDSGDTGASGLVVRADAIETAVADGDLEKGDRIRATGGLGAFNGLLQISSGVSFEIIEEDAGLPNAQDVALTALQGPGGEDYVSELVRVEELTFETEESTFSTDGGDGFGNYAVTGPDGNELVVRIPGSSFYVGEPIPSGSFTFTGVLGQFSGSDDATVNEGYQLLAIAEGDIEDTGGGGGGGGVTDIADARDMIDGDPVTIEGIVTSVGSEEARVEDETAGIFISRREDFATAVTRGDRVRITGSVSEFANQTQIDSDDLTDFDVLSSGNALPEATLLSSLAELDEDDESERVRVEGVTIEAGGDDTFQAGGGEGNYTITDADGNERTLRIPSGSFYGGEPIPSGEVTIEAVGGQFSFDSPDSGYQILARYEDQITGSGDGGGGGSATLLSEDFENADGLGVFSAFSVASNADWARDSFDGNFFAEASGFGADEASNDWLISPALDFSAASDETLAFTSTKGFDGPDFNLKVSTDYSGSGSPENATWTDITDRATLAQNSDKEGGSDFTPAISSGDVDLSDFDGGEVYIAFQYVSDGTGGGEAATWQIDDVVVAEGTATGDDGFPTPPDRP
jgi:uncharacterized protein YdeI (BOF family)